MSPRLALVYTRAGCHLCEQAEELLQTHGFQVETVDIDQDAALQKRFTACVPVVFIDGKERFRGRIDQRLLLRLLRAAEPSNPDEKT